MLLTSNKTLIIAHRKNQNFWSMYVIIDNFNCATRKSQIRFDLLLLNLISMIEKTNNDIKFAQNINSKLYHVTFRHMLKRELTINKLFEHTLTNFDNVRNFDRNETQYQMRKCEYSTLSFCYCEYYDELFWTMFYHWCQIKSTLLYMSDVFESAKTYNQNLIF